MNEKNARQILTISAVSSVTGFVIAIILGLRGQQVTAAIFLILSIVDTVAAWFVYRQYARVRSVRWTNELKQSQDEMSRLLAESAQKEEQEPPVAQP